MTKRKIYRIELTEAQQEVLRPLIDELKACEVEWAQAMIGQLDSNLRYARFTLLNTEEATAMFEILNPGDVKFNAAKIMVTNLFNNGYIAKYPRGNKPETFYSKLESFGFFWTGKFWTDDVKAQAQP